MPKVLWKHFLLECSLIIPMHILYYRIGLVGNPSDGFYGKTIAMSISNFWADVTIAESEKLVSFSTNVHYSYIMPTAYFPSFSNDTANRPHAVCEVKVLDLNLSINLKQELHTSFVTTSHYCFLLINIIHFL